MTELLAHYTSSFFIAVILLVGLNNFIVGKTAVWSIGHIGFFGLGQMVLAVLVLKIKIGIFYAVLTSVLSGLVVAMLVGAITLRLGDDFFIIFSVGFCELVRSLNVSFLGPSGAIGLPHPRYGSWAISGDFAFIALFMIPFLAICLIIAAIMKKRPIERYFALLRRSKEVAKIVGLDVKKYRMIAFCSGSLIAVVAGCLDALFVGGTNTSDLTLVQAVMLFAMVILGGINTICGSILGAAILIGLPRILDLLINHPSSSFYATNISQIIIGLVLIVVIRWLPNGLMGRHNEWFGQR